MKSSLLPTRTTPHALNPQRTVFPFCRSRRAVRPVLVIAAVLLLSTGACDSPPPSATPGPSATPTAPATATIPTAKSTRPAATGKPLTPGIDAWISEVLCAKKWVRVPVRRYYSAQMLPLFSRNVDGRQGGPYCVGVSPDEVRLFTTVGLPAISKLIPLVRDCTESPWFYDDPKWSELDAKSSELPVQRELHPRGVLAVYMIEAILRNHGYSARSAESQTVDSQDVSLDTCHSLARIADAYEQWWSTCYDAESNRLTCSPDEPRALPWDDRFDWQPTFIADAIEE